MKKKIRTILLVSVLLSGIQSLASVTDTATAKNPVEEKIWNLEEAYFTNLYQANYDKVLALVHEQFLGWPGSAKEPVGKKESAAFMKLLIPKPTSCMIRIERSGIRISGAAALTQYTLHVSCSDTDGAPKIPSSRISHTWVKEGDGWKLLGGMSYDK